MSELRALFFISGLAGAAAGRHEATALQNS